MIPAFYYCRVHCIDFQAAGTVFIILIKFSVLIIFKICKACPEDLPALSSQIFTPWLFSQLLSSFVSS